MSKVNPFTWQWIPDANGAVPCIKPIYAPNPTQAEWRSELTRVAAERDDALRRVMDLQARLMKAHEDHTL